MNICKLFTAPSALAKLALVACLPFLFPAAAASHSHEDECAALHRSLLVVRPAFDVLNTAFAASAGDQASGSNTLQKVRDSLTQELRVAAEAASSIRGKSDRKNSSTFTHLDDILDAANGLATLYALNAPRSGTSAELSAAQRRVDIAARAVTVARIGLYQAVFVLECR